MENTWADGKMIASKFKLLITRDHFCACVRIEKSGVHFVLLSLFGLCLFNVYMLNHGLLLDNRAWLRWLDESEQINQKQSWLWIIKGKPDATFPCFRNSIHPKIVDIW